MTRLRLRHRTFTPFGSFSERHVWAGQKWNDDSETWVDQTNEYDSAVEAELALLQNLVDVKFEPTFEHEWS